MGGGGVMLWSEVSYLRNEERPSGEKNPAFPGAGRVF